MDILVGTNLENGSLFSPGPSRTCGIARLKGCDTVGEHEDIVLKPVGSDVIGRIVVAKLFDGLHVILPHSHDARLDSGLVDQLN